MATDASQKRDVQFWPGLFAMYLQKVATEGEVFWKSESLCAPVVAHPNACVGATTRLANWEESPPTLPRTPPHATMGGAETRIRKLLSHSRGRHSQKRKTCFSFSGDGITQMRGGRSRFRKQHSTPPERPTPKVAPRARGQQRYRRPAQPP